ncbi:phosducin-like protein [Moniliophthora roreri MCA 2997]|uniref:Phosducin-like protein n=1 Tax=Moniliophthora roreri (strain MCA 2997) TaxID=1381753 RepID=V2XGI7_MONRO|nr:phosducin-like protein [Moniliophthora roreri MCA 2997]KAI3601329.1 phosducin-like protein [Moniliophthora roreri]
MAQYTDIEALVLSGELFNGQSRSSSPARSESPSSDKGWHDEELAEFESNNEKVKNVPPEAQQESIGMGPGRTGVKGVIRDRDEAVEMNRQKRSREMEEMRKKMEKSSLGGKTFLEEEREKPAGEKVDELIAKEREKERFDVFGRTRENKFGHLREVGVHNFVAAVEKEEKGIWVVVHLYEPSLDRCYSLDETLARLARMYPNTKFLRCRASALGFASLNSGNKSTSLKISRPSRPIRDDDDDPYDEKGYKDADDDYNSEEEQYDEDNVDLDMLPTMLVYRDGELVHNWVRVDWEAGTAGIEELLTKHRILPQRDTMFGGFGVPSDDEDVFDENLLWSDDDDK